MPAYPGFVGGSYVAQSSLVSGERTVNWFIESAETPTATAPMALYPTPGVTLLSTAPTSPGRGMITAQDRVFAVIGNVFYEVDSYTYALTSRGTVATDSRPATLSWNGDGGGQIFITSGDNGYIFDLQSNAFSTVRTGATSMGAHLDGYFLALDAETSTLYLSDLLDGTTWDPTQFAQRSASSDPWVSMGVVDRYLYLFGTQTSEIWYDNGGFPFPFTLHPSGLMPVGTAAAHSVRVAGNVLMWLGATRDGEGQVYRASGFTPEPAGTFAIAVALEGALISEAVADSYTDQGHTFYLLTIPEAGVTWACDITPTQRAGSGLRWTERGTWDSAEGRYRALRTLYHLYVPHTSEHLILDREGSGVYRLTSDSSLDVDGLPIRRLRRAPTLVWNGSDVSVPLFELLVEPGLGALSGQGTTPMVALRVSQDGGKTWGIERWRSAGALGAYGTRVRWLRNGRARGWTAEVVVTDPVPWRILGATVEVA